MYDLRLSAEQLEIRDTIRDFVAREVKPVLFHPDRLQAFGWEVPHDLLDQAAQMGLRALALPEDMGGAGADRITCCMVAEELGAGDAGYAVTLMTTAVLARTLFGSWMNADQRGRYLPKFEGDDRYHLAAVEMEASAGAWDYCRKRESTVPSAITAKKQGNDWVLNGTSALVVNAPVAKLLVVRAQVDGGGDAVAFIVPADAAGVSVQSDSWDAHTAAADAMTPWYLGTAGSVTFKNVKVPAADVLEPAAAQGWTMSTQPEHTAINVGLGRAAWETAIDYAKIRIQGGRPIIEHQPIGRVLGASAMKIEAARNLVMRAAWAADHPDAQGEADLGSLPLDVIAQAFTAEAMEQVTDHSAECFGAMGVMRDMSLHKYVQDSLVFLHEGAGHDEVTLRITEAAYGFSPK